MTISRLNASILIAAALFSASAAQAVTPIAEVNAALIDAIRINGATTRPPKSARALAMVELAMYDSVNAASGLTYTPYSYAGAKVVGASQDAAAYVAGYTMLSQLFPTMSAGFQTRLDTALAGLGLSNTVLGLSRNLGSGIASSLYAARLNDGASAAQTPYVFGSGPGAFQSTNGGGQPLFPGWGAVDAFVVPAGHPFRPGAPPAVGSAAWIASFDEVKALGCVGCGSQWQADTALFWADDAAGTVSPGGRWLVIADDIATQQGLGTFESARLLAMVGAALADASIAAWDTKYSYEVWRPITAIHDCTMATCGVDGDPNWVPVLGTPNFPAYVSGHSTFGGAAASAMAAYFGSDAMNFCVSVDAVYGLASRCYDSFAAAAYENGRSRIFGGVHWEFDDGPGVAMGHAIGDYVAANAFGYAGAVPEPASWALMITGFGLMGGALRRRREAGQKSPPGPASAAVI